MYAHRPQTSTLTDTFQFTNVIGFTYADRDAKARWASGVGFGNYGLAGSMVGSVVKQGVGRFFR